MKEKKKEALRKYQRAVSRLAEAVGEAPSSLQADAVIQRFEFTFELLWKTLKIYMEELGIETQSPREALKTAFKQGWISDEQLILEMLEDRNHSSHIYNESEAGIIFNRVRNSYLPAFQTLLAFLQSK